LNKPTQGKLGEELAGKALKKNGYHIIDKNYRCRYGEIDIVARKKDSLVFIEVRSKTGSSFGSPEESITAAKKRKIMTTALDYIATHENLPPDWRIDFVAVEFDESGKKVQRLEIIENAVS
jgi:putative endonuclease